MGFISATDATDVAIVKQHPLWDGKGQRL